MKFLKGFEKTAFGNIDPAKANAFVSGFGKALGGAKPKAPSMAATPAPANVGNMGG